MLSDMKFYSLLFRMCRVVFMILLVSSLSMYPRILSCYEIRGLQV